MVSREIYAQAVLLASCLGLGGWLMFCYDLLRASRFILPRKYWLVGLEDFIYWIYVSLSSFSLLYRQNDGILRGYVIAGILLGMFCYDRLISQNVMKLLQKAIKRIKMKRKKSCRKKPGSKVRRRTVRGSEAPGSSMQESRDQKQGQGQIKVKDSVRSGDADEEYGKAFPDEKAGQVGEPDGVDGHYRGGAQPGCSGKLKKRKPEGKRSGIPDPGRKPAKADGRGIPEKG